MATTLQIGGVETERVFLTTDWTKDFKIADLDLDPAGSKAKNIAGWAITFDIRKKADSPLPAQVSKTIGAGLTIIGVFNLDITMSTQVVRLTIAAADISIAKFTKDGGTFYYSLKRTDSGSNAILAEGPIVVERATQAS